MIHTAGRHDSLDYLRGLMALAVLIFHYDKWLSGVWDAHTPQGRLGAYAVSVFFVLSGLTLALVYRGRMQWSVASWAHFYRKRFWRIFPLLWLVTGITICLDEFKRPIFDILLNISGLFGWVNAARDIATGAWSIGCELVYYAFFPVILLLGRSLKWFLPVLTGSFVFIAIVIAFFGYPLPNPEQVIWWPVYVQPLNNALFFIAGVWIGLSRRMPANWAGVVFACSVAVFFLWPLQPDPFHLVYGWDRLALSVIILLMVGSYASMDIRQLPEKGKAVMSWLGAISYSLYLWHPIVYRGVQFGAKKLQMTGKTEALWASVILTLMFSHISYRFYEKPLQDKFRPVKNP